MIPLWEYQHPTTPDELYHYGIIGMKWGIRKAKKQGTVYTYKSHAQKKYEKKLTKQTAAKTDKKTIAKTMQKLETYKKRDKNRQDYANRTSVGKVIVGNILMSPLGYANYKRMRAAGYSRSKSLLTTNWADNTSYSNYMEKKKLKKKK